MKVLGGAVLQRCDKCIQLRLGCSPEGPFVQACTSMQQDPSLQT